MDHVVVESRETRDEWNEEVFTIKLHVSRAKKIPEYGAERLGNVVLSAIQSFVELDPGNDQIVTPLAEMAEQPEAEKYAEETGRASDKVKMQKLASGDESSVIVGGDEGELDEDEADIEDYLKGFLPNPNMIDSQTIIPSSLSREQLVELLLCSIGEDPGRDGLVETPRRVAKAWDEMAAGYKESAEDVLSVAFDKEGSNTPYHDMVVLKDIEFYSMCEHHMLPFFGRISIGYIPGERVVGISKLARLVEVFSRRLQIQERLTDQIADAIEAHLNPLGVGIVIEAQHLCMLARGIQKQNSVMTTSAVRGIFFAAETRQEFYNHLK